MKSGKVFFLVNSGDKVNLLSQDLVLLFGTNEYLREKVLAVYHDVIKDEKNLLTVRSGDCILEFYYGSEEVIEKFAMVDVLFSDEPDLVLAKICFENKWHLFDIESGSYII